MRTPSFLIVALLVGLSVLTAVALSSPPDPLWIGGVFDGGDTDGVVLAALSADGATDGAAVDAAEVVLPALGALPAAGWIGVASSAVPDIQGRAPPIG
jgi:hypothetical protein